MVTADRTRPRDCWSLERSHLRTGVGLSPPTDATAATLRSRRPRVRVNGPRRLSAMVTSPSRALSVVPRRLAPRKPRRGTPERTPYDAPPVRAPAPAGTLPDRSASTRHAPCPQTPTASAGSVSPPFLHASVRVPRGPRVRHPRLSARASTSRELSLSALRVTTATKSVANDRPRVYAATRPKPRCLRSGVGADPSGVATRAGPPFLSLGAHRPASRHSSKTILIQGSATTHRRARPRRTARREPRGARALNSRTVSADTAGLPTATAMHGPTRPSLSLLVARLRCRKRARSSTDAGTHPHPPRHLPLGRPRQRCGADTASPTSCDGGLEPRLPFPEAFAPASVASERETRDKHRG